MHVQILPHQFLSNQLCLGYLKPNTEQKDHPDLYVLHLQDMTFNQLGYKTAENNGSSFVMDHDLHDDKFFIQHHQLEHPRVVEMRDNHCLMLSKELEKGQLCVFRIGKTFLEPIAVLTLNETDELQSLQHNMYHMT